MVWNASGIKITGALGEQSGPIPVSNNSSGAIILWWDLRNHVNVNNKYDLYIQRVNSSGSLTSIKTTGKENPQVFQLVQNYPNPFNPATTISYTIPKAGNVQLKVYDALGREVSTLVNTHQESGWYNVNFDASRLSSGMYIYKLTSENFSQVKKMMLLK
jgi:hypothetical protein